MSRVNKNKELYEKLSNSAEGDLSNSSLSSYAEKMKTINNSYDEIASRDENHEPEHAKNIEIKSVSVPDIEIEDTHEPLKDEVEDILWNTFENTYLKEFIDEVKQYNVKKGYRRLSDTNANIIAELNAGSSTRFEVVEDVETDEQKNELENVEKDELIYEKTIISPIYKETESMNDSSDSTMSSEKADENTIAFEVQRMVEEIENFGQIDYISDDDSLNHLSENNAVSKNNDYAHSTSEMHIYDENLEENKEKMKELLETTQQLKIQVDDYKQNLEEMNSRVALTNRVISFLMYVLIVAILVVILLFIWWNLNR